VTQARNPFVPGFGLIPPHLAGRDNLLGTFRRAFAQGPTHRYSSGLLLGPRGVGKTVLLGTLKRETETKQM